MSTVPATTTLRSLLDHLTALGLTAPKAATVYLTKLDALRAAEDAPLHPRQIIDQTDAADLPAAVTAETRRRVENTERQRVTGELVDAAARAAVRAIRDDADALIAQARKGFATAAAPVTKHAAAFAPGSSAAEVLDRGPATAKAWTAMAEAAPLLDRYVSFWGSLYGRPATASTVVETYDGDHWRRVDATAAWESGSRWHALAHAGYALTLHTEKEARALDNATPEKQLRAERRGMGVAMVRG